MAKHLETWAISLSSTALGITAAFQLGICLEVGFGISRDTIEAASWLKTCGHSSESFHHQRETLLQRGGEGYKNAKIQSMVKNGFLRAMDYLKQYRKLSCFATLSKIYNRELDDWNMAFGNAYQVVFTLSMQFYSVLLDGGMLDEAESLLVQIIEDFEQDTEYAPHDLKLNIAREALALQYKRQGKYALASEIALVVIEEGKGKFGDSHPFTQSAKNTLGTIYSEEGEYDQAEILLKQAWEVTKHAFGQDHPQSMSIAGNLALVLLRQGKFAAAEDTALQVYKGSEKMLGASHQYTLTSAGNLAAILRSRGKFAAAEALCEKAFTMNTELYGPLHPSTLRALNSLALLKQDQGRLDIAEKLLKQAIEGRERKLGRTHIDMQTSINNLAGVAMQYHRFKSAENLYKEVLENRQNALGEEHIDSHLGQ